MTLKLPELMLIVPPTFSNSPLPVADESGKLAVPRAPVLLNVPSLTNVPTPGPSGPSKGRKPLSSVSLTTPCDSFVKAASPPRAIPPVIVTVPVLVNVPLPIPPALKVMLPLLARVVPPKVPVTTVVPVVVTLLLGISPAH